jgi:single-stranded DNA-specific DHH superfamily exonuclease
VPDKDADGLSAGVIVHRTLVKLGLDAKHLAVHLVQKGSNIHEEFERNAMLEKKPKFVIVLDQGSRGGPPVIEDTQARSLVIDHHLSDNFPKDAEVSKSRVMVPATTNNPGCFCLPLSTSSNNISTHL